MVITFNYKDDSKEVKFEDLEKSDLGSDFTAFGRPKN